MKKLIYIAAMFVALVTIAGKPDLSKDGGGIDLFVLQSTPVPIGGRSLIMIEYIAHPQFVSAPLTIDDIFVGHPDATTRYDFSTPVMSDCGASLLVDTRPADGTLILFRDDHELFDGETCSIIFSMIVERIADPPIPSIMGSALINARSSHGSTQNYGEWRFPIAINLDDNAVDDVPLRERPFPDVRESVR